MRGCNLALMVMLQGQIPCRNYKMEDRSNSTFDHSLRDRISRRFHTRSRSSRCDTSCDASASRHRRRSARYSSAYMSSAESSPLLNTPASCVGDIPLSQVRADPAQSAVNPLAAVSLMLAATELDRLAVRAGAASEKCSALYQSEASNSGRSSGHVVPPNTPALKSLVSSESVAGCTSTDCATETETPASVPLNTPVVGTDTPLDNIAGVLHALRKHCRRKTSSRISEICAPEGIPEASDEEDLFPSVSTSALGPTPSALDSGTDGLRSLASPTNPTQSATVPSSLFDPIDQAFEKARLTQDQPPKVFLGKTVTRRARTPGLRVEFATPPGECVQPETAESPEKDSPGLGARPRLRNSSSHHCLYKN